MPKCGTMSKLQGSGFSQRAQTEGQSTSPGGGFCRGRQARGSQHRTAAPKPPCMCVSVVFVSRTDLLNARRSTVDPAGWRDGRTVATQQKQQR
jgi:hypothetical protein